MRALYITCYICVLSAGVSAQKSFYRGALLLDFNTGIEFYNSTNMYTMVGAGFISDTTVYTQTGNSNFSLGAEVGIGKHIGIGLRGKASTFFRSLDAVMNARADIRTTDLLLTIQAHPLRLKKFDLMLGAEVGLSQLKFDVNDLAQTLVTGRGGIFGFYLNPRFYFKKRFGFNVRASLPVFNYRHLKQVTAHTDNYIITQWKGRGMGISFGLQYRFF